MTRLVVVGGGVAGLAAAWEATRAAGVDEVVVVEAAPRTGGKLRTTPLPLPDGTSLLLDEGADAFLARRPEAVALLDELGLGGELTSPAVGRAKVVVDGELRPLPSRTVLGVPLDPDDPEVAAVVGEAGVAELRAAGMDHPPLEGDAAIGPLLRSRLGPTVVERLVAPLVGGINAGDVDRLSVRAVTPQLAAAAARGGPLTAAAAATVVPADGPVFVTPLGGTQRLVDRLAEALVARGVEVRTGAPVRSLEASGTTVEVVLDRPGTGGTGGPDGTGGTERTTVAADAVVVATPAHVAARLLRTVCPSAAELLAQVPHASVAVVTLVLDRAGVTVPLDAAGVLVPRAERTAVTAVSWGSTKWAHWDDGRHVVLRASVGHDGDDRGRTLDDDALVNAVRADLARVMGVTAPPVAVRVSRWTDGFPQYRPGHEDLVARVRATLAARAPQVTVAGMAYDGVGVPASIGSGRAAVRRLAGRVR